MTYLERAAEKTGMRQELLLERLCPGEIIKGAPVIDEERESCTGERCADCWNKQEPQA